MVKKAPAMVYSSDGTQKTLIKMRKEINEVLLFFVAASSKTSEQQQHRHPGSSAISVSRHFHR